MGARRIPAAGEVALAAGFDRALRDAIDVEIARVPGDALRRAAEALSRRYRDEAGGGIGRLGDVERLAYAAVRLPATAAALDAAFAAYGTHGGPVPASITDLGAGPATVLWPAASRWPDLGHVTLVDRDAEMLRLGVRVWSHGAGFTPGLPPRVQTLIGDLAGYDAPPADLVVLSYALGEAEPARADPIVDIAFALARQAVVVVEPGTPAGFARIRAARDRLRAAGAVLVAPCPHADACPMAGEDWCHFAVRLDRSRVHRLLKQAELGWEDEKFSYVIAAPRRAAWPRRAEARVVRRPRRETGHVRLTLCAPGGLADTVITRRAADYKAARDVEWGDAWPRG